MKGSIADAALLALETERYRDVAAEFFSTIGPSSVQPGIGVVEFELPGAVQVLPGVALELRLGVLRPRDLRHRGGGQGGDDNQDSAHGPLMVSRARTRDEGSVGSLLAFH